MNRTIKKTGCFLIGVTGHGWTSNGASFIGSVSDDPYDIRTFLKKAHDSKGFDHIGTELISTTESSLTDRGYFARPNETTRGLNEAGLGFTCAMVIENNEFDKPKDIPIYANITAKMMRTCPTVESAVNLFKSYGATYPAYSVLLTDALGDLAHLEVGSFGISVLHYHSVEEPGCVMAVNCYRTPDFVKYNDPLSQLENLANNNAVRFERGQVLAKKYKGQFDIESLAQVLSDHINCDRDPLGNPVLSAWGYSICNHGTRSQDQYPYEDLPWGTVSSEIIEPKRGLFWYSYGWTCGSKPTFKDQLYQENSWGQFLPFSINTNLDNPETILHLSTTDGKLTSDGVKHLFIS